MIINLCLKAQERIQDFRNGRGGGYIHRPEGRAGFSPENVYKEDALRCILVFFLSLAQGGGGSGPPRTRLDPQTEKLRHSVLYLTDDIRLESHRKK